MLKKVSSTLAAVLVAVAVQVTGTAAVAHADAAAKGGDFVSIPSAPVVLDTRSGIGATGQRGPASTTTFTVTGGAVPTSGVSSVLVRIGVLNPTDSTFVEMWPDGQPRPSITHVSAVKDESISNFAIVKVGPLGKVSLYNNAGKTDITVEVHGYFSGQQGATGGGFFPVTPTRLIDTRPPGTGTNAATIPAGGTRTVTLTGDLIPVGSPAAFVNLLVPGASTAGWLAAAPGTGTARPILNYAAGSTQSGAVVPLSSDGKVTFTNKGTAAINLVVSAEGYFAGSSNQGAGYREVTKRLLNTRTVGNAQPVPANGTIDVQVGGTNGLPTQGVAGVAVNVIATPEKDGYLKAWPVGATEPSVSMMDFNAGDWRDNLMVLKPGTDGKIRIRNGSSGTTHIIVDLLGWFADPLASQPIAQNTKMAMVALPKPEGAQAGTLEHAFVDNGGDLRWGHQKNVDVEGAVDWYVISQGQAFTGQPAITVLPDSRLQITALKPSGDVWSITQKTVGGTDWNDWTNLGGYMAAPPQAAKLGNGTVVLFDSDNAGKLWAYAQTGAIPFWRNLGDQDFVAGTVRALAVQGGIRVFGVTPGGSVKTIEYYDDGSLSAWTDLGGTGLNGQPSVVLRPGFVPQVFVRGADGSIQSKLQDQGGAWPSEWQQVGTEIFAGVPDAIMDPGPSKIAIAVRGTDNEIYIVGESATASNTWFPKVPVSDTSDPANTDPTTTQFINSGGSTYLVGFRNVNNVPHFYSRKNS
ncbi:hypothetical protein [Actinocrispum sp. NPDC049592]|uniref:hypothetical protein n=1 Tax=Actinocrispum sp. NPDC049592 TaxID=3154835 RepID=UPI003437358F